jgi:hypothetical protein
VRHREAAERTLLTAISAGFSPAEIADALFAAATERAFADTGHSLDFINKAFECLDLVGWQHAAALLPTVVGQMVAARGAEESTAWRQPVDLVALCENSTSELADLFAAGRGSREWSGHAALAQELLGDDPAGIVDALNEAIRAGAAPADLGRSLAYAVALRVARFGNANEHADWETAHHVFTYANAVHQMLTRIGLPTSTITSRPSVACCTERWRSTLLAISMCRRRASQATAASSSTICPRIQRRSAPPCSTPSTGRDRATSPQAWWPGISHSA